MFSTLSKTKNIYVGDIWYVTCKCFQIGSVEILLWQKELIFFKNDKTLDLIKLKTFADDISDATQMIISVFD